MQAQRLVNPDLLDKLDRTLEELSEVSIPHKLHFLVVVTYLIAHTGPLSKFISCKELIILGFLQDSTLVKFSYVSYSEPLALVILALLRDILEQEKGKLTYFTY